MPKFMVPIERTYTARHVHYEEIEAADEAAAIAAVQAGLDSGEIDPSGSGTYSDTQESEGYDDADAWEIDEDHISETEEA